MAWRLNAAIEARDQAPPEQFFDIRYQEMLEDPFGAIANAYAHFGLEYSDEAQKRMRAYLDTKPQGKHGVHTYSFDDLGLDLATERERFRPYQERFGVPSEVV